MLVKINQQEFQFDQTGLTILSAVRQIGIELPTLCHDERLKPCGECRMCLVEIKGKEYPVTACNTPLAAGMEILTHTAALESERRGLLAMLAARYPVEPVKQFPDKPFHQLLKQYELTENCYGSPDASLRDDSHPYLHIDMTQCVDCYRCVRICREVQGQFVWEVLNRGSKTRILPSNGNGTALNLRDSDCVSCGACVDTCPTGALEDQSILKLGQATDWTKTTCPYCGTGCEMEVGTRNGRIVTVRPALDAPVNHGHLCVKGRYGFEFVYAPDRVGKPMIRLAGEWKEVAWTEAIQYVADRLMAIKDCYGADSIGVLGSARATNEENYLAQKFARVVIGTNNVDCCARVCHGPTAAAMKITLGTGAATNSYDDIEQARTILLCGTNATENHPIVGARIKQAVLKGAQLIVIDPREIELARYADIHLALKPGTNVPLFNALANVIVAEKLYDEAYVSTRVDEWDAYREFIKDFTPESVAELCEVPAEKIRQAARLYAKQTPSLMMHGLGMTEHVQGTEGVMALVNLALLTGNLGKPGTGVNPLRGQNNVQGSAHMGCEPSNLTGYISLADGKMRFEQQWQQGLPATQGLNLMQMMDAARNDQLKALWATGYDILLTNADAASTTQALEKLEFVIVQDMFLNETARQFAHVFLPAASSFEKDGTFMNAERRVQRVRAAIEPLGESKADWEIVCEIAKAMGHGDQFAFENANEIWDEVRAVWPAGQGISYARLELAGIQWPCPSETHPGTRILHTEKFPVGERAALRRIEFHATPETLSDEFPFLLNTGRTLTQFNAGTMTMRTENHLLRDTDYLDISQTDAERLQLSEGELVKLRSHYGAAEIPVHISKTVKPGELFATFHTTKVFLNQITSPHRDGYVGAPEFKVTAVRIEKLD